MTPRLRRIYDATQRFQSLTARNCSTGYNWTLDNAIEGITAGLLLSAVCQVPFNESSM
jgi:hypothetical protein